MTVEIALVLGILIIAILLFLSERLRVDLIALLVLGVLAITGLVTPGEALSGFSNNAVVTVWAMFIISAGLAHTGVARVIGQYILRLAGSGEAQLIAVIMVASGVMSAFMNNIGVAALLLPVVMDLGKRTGHPPSRLLMPLAFGSLLGGLTTLIGTPPNILVSDALREYGLQPFQLLDFAPVGVVVLAGGIIFMVTIGRLILPVKDPERDFIDPRLGDLGALYALGERIFITPIHANSPLAGKSLAESQIGAVLGFNVIGILRDGRTLLSPSPDEILLPNDKLMILGRSERLAELEILGQIKVEDAVLDIDNLMSSEIDIAKVSLAPNSAFIGRNLREIDFRRRFGLNVLSILRAGQQKRTHLQHLPLTINDILLVQGPRQNIEILKDSPDFLLSEVETTEVTHLNEHLMAIHVLDDSPLVGKSLSESHLGSTSGLTVVGIARGGATLLAPPSTERLGAGDILLVEGNQEEIEALVNFQDMEIEREMAASFRDLETEEVGLAEAVLSPHSTLFDQSLRQIRFRDKYGLSVLAIWREGRAYRTNLSNMPLRLGDALLIYGHRQKMKLLAREPDFLVLYEEAQEPLNVRKAPLAVLIMAGVLLPVFLGWIPIAIAAVVGAAVMVLTRCLTMEEAYRAIEWKAVFLIAGMIPLGIAMETSGAARLLADWMIALVGGLGPLGILAGIFLLTSVTTQAMPSAAVTVLMVPIAMNTSLDMGLSPYSLLMAVAIAASASFLSPVAHPANVLVLGPGGYRFTDYIKVGVPLTIVVLALVILVLPVFWPLN
ncbi:MAG: SLC13 family permease [Anaerolineales bacterium]|nr:SLC13 family permease [Anaerolineales bacterium]